MNLTSLAGQILLPVISEKIPEKAVVIASLVACSSTVLGLIFSGGYFSILCILRFLFGFFQIIFISFIMAWVEAFGDTKF